MKRTLLTIATAAAVAVGSAGYGGASAATPAPVKTDAPKDACSSEKSKFAHDACEKFQHSAPGDEYFGRMKMSYLGINNTFHDEFIRAGAYTTDPNLINKVNFADEALTMWAHKYPGDPQLARSYFLAIQVYKKIYIKQYQDKAWQYMHTLTSTFPTTYFGKLEKTDLAKGFTQHYFANAELCPTPLPTETPEPNQGKGRRSTPTPTPSPTPTPTPTPAPTPTPKPGAPKVEVIVPPCVKQSPPVESPLPSASPLQSPAASPLPSAGASPLPSATTHA